MTPNVGTEVNMKRIKDIHGYPAFIMFICLYHEYRRGYLSIRDWFHWSVLGSGASPLEVTCFKAGLSFWMIMLLLTALSFFEISKESRPKLRIFFYMTTAISLILWMYLEFLA